MTPDEFRGLLLEKTAAEIVESCILTDDPGPYIDRNALGVLERQARATFSLRADHALSTIVVGSAKLGFSFLEKKARKGVPRKPAYRPYVPGESDIDVAVVSPLLYMRIWSDLARFGATQTLFPWGTDIARYMLHGWIRPDKFPPEVPKRCIDWKEMIRDISQMTPFKYKRLRCGIFHSKYFLEIYQQRGVFTAQQIEMNQ